MKFLKITFSLLLMTLLAMPSTLFGQGVVGTLNAMDLNFVTNNVHRMTLTTNGDLRVGITNTPNGSANVAIGSNNAINNVNSNSNLLSGWRNVATNAGACVLGGMQNTAVGAGGGFVSKSVAFGWNNRINHHNQYLIGAANSATMEYSGTFGVGLNVAGRGTYYIGGNSGTNLTDRFDNTLAIGWGSSHHTGLFDINGLTLGTSHQGGSNNVVGNDLATARLDVYGLDFTAANGTYYPSGVRFRNLPQRFARILVIDDRGYVYDSGIELEELLAGNINPNNGDLQKQVDELTQALEALKAQVAAMGNTTTTIPQQTNAALEIFPNPTTGAFTISHFIPNTAQNANIVLTGMNGQEIFRTDVSQRGASKTNLTIPSAVGSGTYLCSFYVDGKLIETQKVEYFQ